LIDSNHLDEIETTSFEGMTEEEIEGYMSKWFGEGFTDATKGIFARAVLSVTESMNEDLEELAGITEVLAERVCELERELIFREVTGEMITTNRERFRAQVEHIEYDDDASFKTKLLTEKRRLFGKTTGNPDPLNEEDAYEPKEHRPEMRAYLAATTKIAYQ
jgi:hypothetical protein